MPPVGQRGQSFFWRAVSTGSIPMMPILANIWQLRRESVQANDGGGFAFVKVTKDGLADVGAKLLPCISFGDDGMSKRPCDETAVGVVLGDLKHNFAHGFSLTKRWGDGKKAIDSWRPVEVRQDSSIAVRPVSGPKRRWRSALQDASRAAAAEEPAGFGLRAR